MTAAAGFPTLRLVRWSIEQLSIDGFVAGEVRQIDGKDLYASLGISGSRAYQKYRK